MSAVKKCKWKPRWPGDFMHACGPDRHDHDTKDSFINFHPVHGHELLTITELDIVIKAVKPYERAAFAAWKGDQKNPQRNIEHAVHRELLKKLQVMLAQAKKSTAHLPVGDEA